MMDQHQIRQVVQAECEKFPPNLIPVGHYADKRALARLKRNDPGVLAEECPAVWFVLEMIELRSDYSVFLTPYGLASANRIDTRGRRAKQRAQRQEHLSVYQIHAHQNGGALTYCPFANLDALLEGPQTHP